MLDNQVYLLSRNWPASATGPASYPPTCTPASATASKTCPDSNRVRASFTSVDWTGATWTVSVRDNGGQAANFYSDAVTSAQPSWDQDGLRPDGTTGPDGKVWVRAQATAGRRTRTLVALVAVETSDLSLAFPHNVITAGAFETRNLGNKPIVDTQGSSAQSAPLAVRCPDRTPECLYYRAVQVAPDTTQPGYSGGNALTSDQLNQLRNRAIASGTYYATGCPSDYNGPIVGGFRVPVFVENGDCTIGANVKVNSRTSPGMLVIARGTLSLGGTSEFDGVIYMANLQQSSGAVVTLSGTAEIWGSVAVDGAGKVSANASGVNIVYDSSVFNSVVGYGNAGIIQNTWREIPSGP